MKSRNTVLVMLTSTMTAVLFLSTAGSGNGTVQNYEVYDFSGFYDQLEPYLERYHDPNFDHDSRNLRGRFSYQPGKEYDLYGSADMVYLLWTINELEPRTTEQGRREWASLIQSFQDPDTGWFCRGNETMHFKAHATAYATGALALLGHRPLHPFKWAEPITRNQQSMDKWLSGIWWDVVWVGSHSGGGVAASLLMTGEAPDQWFDWYLDWLDREVNPETGLWQRAWFKKIKKRPTMHDMGGAAHFWWIYQHRSRPIPYPEQVIDTLLGLQLDSGLWDRKPKKGDFPYCIDLDAVNGIKLAYLTLQESKNEYRTDDVERALERHLGRSCEVLTSPGALEGLYGGNSHDLPGALIGVAEADLFFKTTTGRSRLQTERPWRSVLEVICWL